MTSGTPALLTDLYQLTMLQGYVNQRMEERAVFEFFVRRLPEQRNFLIAAGLEQVVHYLETFRFTSEELDWLKSTERFSSAFLRYLERIRFTGDVDAMPEGTVFFANEPILRVTAPMPQAQIVETRIINLLHYQTVVASKAARCVLVAPGKTLVDFGLRRAHGAEAGLLAARACYLAGFSASSNVLAGQIFGIPISGTMAHSFVQSFNSEEEAFLAFARANRNDVVLLIDTYDTEVAAGKVTRIALKLKSEGITIRGVRLDSGDLADHALKVRKILDDAGLREVTIFASGNLDELELQKLIRAGAPIDGFGIGTRIDTSSDCSYLDCAYKLQEYAGHPRFKRSEGKATWPGRKQVYRRFSPNGEMASDTVTLDTEVVPGAPLLKPVMLEGKRAGEPAALPHIRAFVAEQLRLLPEPIRSLEPATAYPVSISTSLTQLAKTLTLATAPPRAHRQVQNLEAI